MNSSRRVSHHLHLQGGEGRAQTRGRTVKNEWHHELVRQETPRRHPVLGRKLSTYCGAKALAPCTTHTFARLILSGALVDVWQ